MVSKRIWITVSSKMKEIIQLNFFLISQVDEYGTVSPRKFLLKIFQTSEK